MSSKEVTGDGTPQRIVIIGGHSGGNGFMSQTRRFTDKTEIVLLEKDRYVGTVKCGLTHYLAGTLPSRETLVSTDPIALARRFRSDIRLRHEVISIDRALKTLSVRDLSSDTTYQLGYDKLVLATGASPAIAPDLPGIELSGVRCLRTIADMDGIVEQLRNLPASHATVVGAGTIGLQAAEALRQRGLDVTLIERSNQVMRHIDQEMAALLHRAVRASGVRLLLETAALGFFAEDARIRMRLNKGSELVTDLVILATGIKPNSALAQAAGLAIGTSGSVSVDKFMRTSDPDIYAVGDLIETPCMVTGKPIVVQISAPISRQSRVAAAHIFGRPMPYRDALASFAWQIFGQTVASTGANEQHLKEAQRPFQSVFIPTTNHVTFFPGATPLYLKLLFCPAKGLILGAQAVGDGADKRIDVLATAITGKLTVDDLEYLELCYSPPFGNPRDAINQAGGMASGMIRGTKQIIQPDMVNNNNAEFVLDVRSEDEFTLNAIPGSINIPLEQLRARLDELPRHTRIVICCQIGSKAHTVQRTLTLNGFDAVTLMGGYTGWKLWNEVINTDHSTTDHAVFDNPVFYEERRRATQHTDTDRRQPWQGANIDARGLLCPGPIMTLRKQIAALMPGQTIRIHASDPTFPRDLEIWCNRTGHALERIFISSSGSEAYCSKIPLKTAQTA